MEVPTQRQPPPSTFLFLPQTGYFQALGCWTSSPKESFPASSPAKKSQDFEMLVLQLLRRPSDHTLGSWWWWWCGVVYVFIVVRLTDRLMRALKVPARWVLQVHLVRLAAMPGKALSLPPITDGDQGGSERPGRLPELTPLMTDGGRFKSGSVRVPSAFRSPSSNL